MNSSHVTGELNLFSNVIDNFIFISALESVSGGDSLTDQIPTFEYRSEKALLYGGELYFDVHPHPFDWIHFENTLSVVYGERVGSYENENNLPYIPAPVITSEIKTEFNNPFKSINEIFIKGGIKYVLDKNRIYTYNNTESKTPSYLLVNFGAGIDLNLFENVLVTFYSGIDNIFDTGYQHHLGRLKYAPQNYANGRTGIYEMGRSINFKLFLKINSKT